MSPEDGAGSGETTDAAAALGARRLLTHCDATGVELAEEVGQGSPLADPLISFKKMAL